MGAALTRQLFNRYRAMKESLSSCRSPARTVIELGPLGDDGGAAYRRSHTIEERHLEYAHLVYLFEHLLTPEDLRVVVALESPLPHAKRCDQSLGEGRNCNCGALQYYERTVRDGEVVLKVREDGSMPVHETKHGEWFIGPARYPKDHERAGEVVEGWSRVGGSRPVYPTRAAAAQALGISVRLLRRHFDSANAKVEMSAQSDALSEL